MKEKILVIDDERDILYLLRDVFLLNNYQVFPAANATEALNLLQEEPNLILLDINMPGTDGVELCKQIRPQVHCPILFLTARTSPDDVVQGLLVGGDDYIKKPFNVRELLHRVQAHLRREHRASSQRPVLKEGLQIDYNGMTVFYNGKPLSFTKTEFSLIELLSMHPGFVFSRERIYETIRGYDAEGDSEVVTEHIRKIRNKFSAVGCAPCIDTVWGVGYKWSNK